MAEQSRPPNMALLMNGSLEMQEINGRVSSVCLHPTKDLVVSVHEHGVWNEGYCSVFKVNRETVGKILTRPKLFNSGKHSSVALVYKEEHDKTTAIATYRYVFDKGFCYRIGILNEADNSVEWQNDRNLGRGVKPKISASKNGTLAVVYEEPYSINEIQCKIGTVDTSINPPDITLQDKKLVDFNGVEPDVAINDNTIVVICRYGFYTLQTKIGTFDADHQIQWGPTQQLPSNGINPAISINSKGYIVEIHQTKMFRRLTRNSGKILPNRTIAWSEPTTYTQGEYPTVSINDDNFVFEMHKSNFGLKLFYSQGELRVTEINESQSENNESRSERNESRSEINESLYLTCLT